MMDLIVEKPEPAARGYSVELDNLTTATNTTYDRDSDSECQAFYNHQWQDKNSITRFDQLKAFLSEVVTPGSLSDIEAGLSKSGMSIRLNPYVMSLINWKQIETDPIRRQFLPMLSEMEEDHPCLVFDSLGERDRSPVQGLVHRYPDKVLFLVTSVCPVYCQYCTRSYAVGTDTPILQKESVSSPQFWQGALDYIRATSSIEDVVVSGGDISRLKPAHLLMLGNSLLDIDHVRRIRFATKALSVLPMKILSDTEWVNALLSVADRGRKLFKHVCLHTHFNHPREITSTVGAAMRRLHEAGLTVRNQTVLLRGVNDDARTLVDLCRGLARVNIHPYYVYLCDMVRSIEHFRLPVRKACELEKAVRGATAGFNTPVFIVDSPGGKRDVHSAECHNGLYGVSAFISPNVSKDRLYYYFDPIRDLPEEGKRAWGGRGAAEKIIATLEASRAPLDPTRTLTTCAG
jgi:lysine 2,3-aminomutase